MEDLSEGLCVGEDPGLWDPDTHHHVMLGARNACWICEEAQDFCIQCPVNAACFREAQRTRESFMIRAGMAWTNGRARDLSRRRRT